MKYNLDEYAKIGLRTLLLAEKELTEDEFNSWDSRYKQASSSMVDRESKMNAL